MLPPKRGQLPFYACNSLYRRAVTPSTRKGRRTCHKDEDAGMGTKDTTLDKAQCIEDFKQLVKRVKTL